MTALSREAHVVAIDLPGIGESKTPPHSNDKKTLARHVHGLIESLKLPPLTKTRSPYVELPFDRFPFLAR